MTTVRPEMDPCLAHLSFEDQCVTLTGIAMLTRARTTDDEFCRREGMRYIQDNFTPEMSLACVNFLASMRAIPLGNSHDLPSSS